MDKYEAEATFCKKGKDCQPNHISGTWSPIYDQSLLVELENGLRFLSNFKYALKPEISTDPVKEQVTQFAALKTGDYNKFESMCDQTMVGFVMDIPKVKNNQQSLQQHKMQCFYGV